MKKFLCIIIMLFIVFSMSSLAKPVKGKGSMILKFQVTMLKRFFDLDKGTYKNRTLIQIYNTQNGKKYEDFVKNGYVYYLNLPPGNYAISYWSLKGDQSAFSDNFGNQRIVFSIKADTFTVLNSYEISVTYKEDINNWDSFSGHLDTQVENKVDNNAKEEIKKYFLEELDKKNLWKDVSFE
jgi:hypothetical protein